MEPPPPSLDLSRDRKIVYSGGPCLGRGRDTTVWQCILIIGIGESATSQEVAVKCGFAVSESDAKLFEDEKTLWESLGDDDHILELLEAKVVVEDTPRKMWKYYFVMTSMQCNLTHLIFEDEEFRETCTYLDVLKILVGVCTGIQFLHNSSVIHFDVKGENVLVDGNWRAIVADFSHSKRICQNRCSVTATLRGTIYTMAPEVIVAPLRRDSEIRLTTAVDVYSFGVLLWIILNNCTPTGMVDPTTSRNVGRYIKWGSFLTPKDVWCGGPAELCNLVESCLQYHGDCNRSKHNRPPIQNVLGDLQEMMDKPWAGERVLPYCKSDEEIDEDMWRHIYPHPSTKAKRLTSSLFCILVALLIGILAMLFQAAILQGKGSRVVEEYKMSNQEGISDVILHDKPQEMKAMGMYCNKHEADNCDERILGHTKQFIWPYMVNSGKPKTRDHFCGQFVVADHLPVPAAKSSDTNSVLFIPGAAHRQPSPVGD